MTKLPNPFEFNSATSADTVVVSHALTPVAATVVIPVSPAVPFEPLPSGEAVPLETSVYAAGESLSAASSAAPCDASAAGAVAPPSAPADFSNSDSVASLPAQVDAPNSAGADLQIPAPAAFSNSGIPCEGHDVPARPSPSIASGMSIDRANAGGCHDPITPSFITSALDLDEAPTALENTSLNAGSASSTAPAACGPERDIFGAANSIPTAALGPISKPLCETGSENSRASEVDAGSGKSAPKKVEVIGKDCNADDLAARAVTYRAPPGASHGASIPDSETQYIPELFSVYAARRCKDKISPPLPKVERHAAPNFQSLFEEIKEPDDVGDFDDPPVYPLPICLDSHPRDLDLDEVFHPERTRSIIGSLLKLAGVSA
jgi:hypothetical protein